MENEKQEYNRKKENGKAGLSLHLPERVSNRLSSYKMQSALLGKREGSVLCNWTEETRIVERSCTVPTSQCNRVPRVRAQTYRSHCAHKGRALLSQRQAGRGSRRTDCSTALLKMLTISSKSHHRHTELSLSAAQSPSGGARKSFPLLHTHSW